jgi:hypothetical protein
MGPPAKTARNPALSVLWLTSLVYCSEPSPSACMLLISRSQHSMRHDISPQLAWILLAISLCLRPSSLESRLQHPVFSLQCETLGVLPDTPISPNSNTRILPSFTELHQKKGVAIRMSFKLALNARIWFWSAQTSAQNSDYPSFFFFFPQAALAHRPSTLFSFSPSLSLLTWWLIEAREEPFHNSRYPLNYSLNIRREAFEFKFHVFFVSIFMNDVKLKPSWW